MAREFKSLEEILALDGFDQTALVEPEQYAGVEGPYHLPEEVKCQLRETSGKPCGERHKHGWVLRLKSGKRAMVGGTCALTHFGLKADELQRDMGSATNSIARERELAEVQRRLAERHANLLEIQAELKRLLDAKERVSKLQSRVGKLAWRMLEDMAMTGRSDVRVAGIRTAKYDKDGERVRDRIEISITIGAIRAASIAKPSTIVRASDQLRSIATAYRTSDLAAVDASKRSLKLLAVALSQHEAAVLEARELLEAVALFEKNPFELLAFGIRDKSERYKLVRTVLGLSAEAAKSWLASQEAMLKTQHGVDRIEPG